MKWSEPGLEPASESFLIQQAGEPLPTDPPGLKDKIKLLPADLNEMTAIHYPSSKCFCLTTSFLMQERNRKTKNKETKGCLLNSTLLLVFRNLWVTKNYRAWVLEIPKFLPLDPFRAKSGGLFPVSLKAPLFLSCFLVGPSSFCPSLQGQVSGSTFPSASWLMHSVPGTLLSAAPWLWPKQTQSLLACSL